MVTVEAVKQDPSAPVLARVKTCLEQQKGKILRVDQPKQLQGAPRVGGSNSPGVENPVGPRFLDVIIMCCARAKTPERPSALESPAAQQQLILQGHRPHRAEHGRIWT